MQTEHKEIADFLKSHNVGFTFKPTERADYEGDKDAAHFEIEIFNKERPDGKRLKTTYSVGSGNFYRCTNYSRRTVYDQEQVTIARDQYLRKGPSLVNVMWSLCSDANTVEFEPLFEDWASSLGYDEDSRKAEAIFRECQRIRDTLVVMFGREFVEQSQEVYQDF